VRASLAREFNLPLPDGQSYGRDKDILAAYDKALAIEEERTAQGLQAEPPLDGAVNLIRFRKVREVR
jgi:hypothetical protein